MADSTSSLFDRLVHYFRQLGELSADYPASLRTLTERRAEGHLLFARGVELSDEIICVVRRYAPLYTGLPYPIEELEQHQAAADQSREIRIYLQGLLERYQQEENFHQACANRISRAILEHVLAGAKNPGLAPGIPHRRRLHLLERAIRILHGARQGLGKKPPARRQPSEAPGTLPENKAADRKRKAAERAERLGLRFGSLGKKG